MSRDSIQRIQQLQGEPRRAGWNGARQDPAMALAPRQRAPRIGPARTWRIPHENNAIRVMAP